jgi:hypothetical protein
MRVIIAGSRSIEGLKADDLVSNAVKNLGYPITTLLCGMANGVDMAGYRWAIKNIGKENIEEYPADWKKYGKAAGYHRNEDMLKRAEGLIVIWDGRSNGAAHIWNRAVELQLSALFMLRLNSMEVME